MAEQEYTPLPDIELMVCDWLGGHSLIDALVSGRVTTELAAGVTFPCITIQRVGGIPAVDRWLDKASIQVSCWGDVSVTDGRYLCHTLARKARAAMFDMRGYVHAQGVCTGVEDDQGMIWQPDASADPTLPRYVFGVAVYAHPVVSYDS